MVMCPKCTKTNVRYAMDCKMPRDFDEERQLTVTEYECSGCETKLKFIGPVCIDCAGMRRIETIEGKKRINKKCPACKGVGCNPVYIDIEWGTKERSRTDYEQGMLDEGMHAFNQRQAVRHHSKREGKVHCSSCGYPYLNGKCECDTTNGSTATVKPDSDDYRLWKGGW